jgi:type IV pilus assembly protein PilA
MMSKYLQDKRDEEGFTLIELLVVVIIIGILAAIAIPVFLNQRENAWRSAAQSDVRSAAVEVESFMTQTQNYPANQAAFDGLPIQTSPEVDLTYVPVGTPISSYTITADHDRLPGTDNAVYDSAAGGLQ